MGNLGSKKNRASIAQPASKEEHQAAKKEQAAEAADINKTDVFGVSLKHLASLPIPDDAPFAKAREYVCELTKDSGPNRSYARYLMKDPATKNFVKPVADYFVSYAWAGQYGVSMRALKEMFAKEGEDDVFLWMDFASKFM